MPVIIAYEGWDAAGKGGNIKRIAGALDPRGYDEGTYSHLFWEAVCIKKQGLRIYGYVDCKCFL